MSQSYSRPLDNDLLVEKFLYDQLGYAGEDDIIPLIVKGEMGLPKYINASTLDNLSFRKRGFSDDKKRWELRKRIVTELFTLPQEEDDDKIALREGGALPKSGLKNGSEAIIIIGLPASGKSSVAKKVSEEYGALILDSDFAKRKLPEFSNYESGASLVHAESDSLIFSFNRNDKPEGFKTLFELAVEQKLNLIIPKIGHNYQSIKSLAELLKNDLGYKVHLILVNLDRKDATLRAVERYRITKRYVPLGLIFDGYGNGPILTYYILKSKEKLLFSSFGEVTTKNRPSTCTDIENDSPAKLFK